MAFRFTFDGPFVHIWCQRCDSNKSILSRWKVWFWFTTSSITRISIFFFNFYCRLSIIFPCLWISHFCITVLLNKRLNLIFNFVVWIFSKGKMYESLTSEVFTTSNFATWRMLLSGLLIGSAVWILYSRTLMLQYCFMLGWGSLPVYMQLWFSTMPSDSLNRVWNHERISFAQFRWWIKEFWIIWLGTVLSIMAVSCYFDTNLTLDKWFLTLSFSRRWLGVVSPAFVSRTLISLTAVT